MDNSQRGMSQQQDEKKEGKRLQQDEQHESAAQQPEFKELNEDNKTEFSDIKMNGKGIEFLLDIPLSFKVELGRTKMLIKDILQLGQGSVVELDKLAGEPMEILVNNKLIAKGEVVVVNEKFGIRLTDILSPIERVRQLR